MRACVVLLLLLLAFAAPEAAWAQDQETTPAAGDGDTGPGAEAGPPGTSPEGPTQTEAATSELPRVPPVVVISVVSDHVPAEAAVAIRDAVVEQLRPSVARREVVAVSDEETLTAVQSCTDEACVGAIIAQQGAISGVLVRMERRRNRDPVTVMIGVVDPVSGAARGTPVEGLVPPDQLETPAEALAPLTAPLASLMPPAPRRTSLLVAANTDDATVTVDDQEVGTTPIAPGNISPGEHTVTLSRPGFLVQTQRVQITAGDNARLNFDLEPTAEQAASDVLNVEQGLGGAEASSGGGGGILGEWWFWAGAAGGVVVLGVLIAVIAAVASSGPEQQDAISVPAIVP